MAEYKTRLPEQKYSEAEYLFQTIEMAKSDEEYDICTTDSMADNMEPAATIFSWKLVKHRRPNRRYTTHGCPAPPAPPSTPTSLTASSTPTPSPTASNNLTAEEDPINSLLYILDYAPKYKKKLKEQQRTDAELAELFNVVTITSSGNCRAGSIDENRSSSSSKLPPERGISAASRVIRKPDASTKIFKIHRNPKEFFREPDEEDSVSAPEYDTEDIQEDIRYRLMRFKSSRRLLQTKRHRRFARFEHQDRVNAMVDNFDAAMSFNDA